MSAAAETGQQLSPEQKEFQEAVQRGANDVMDSLTGFDEIAVAQSFGREVEDLGYLTTLRAFVFVLERRKRSEIGPAVDAQVRAQVMELTSKAVQEQLAEHGGEGEIFEDEPSTDQGKDGGVPELPPLS